MDNYLYLELIYTIKFTQSPFFHDPLHPSGADIISGRSLTTPHPTHSLGRRTERWRTMPDQRGLGKKRNVATLPPQHLARAADFVTIASSLFPKPQWCYLALGCLDGSRNLLKEVGSFCCWCIIKLPALS